MFRLENLFSISTKVCKGVDPDTKVGGDGLHVNPERSFGGTNGEPPSEASQLWKGGPGVLLRKISKTYMANGAIYVIPELYLWILLAYIVIKRA